MAYNPFMHMHKKFFGVVAIFLVQWQTEAQTLTKTQLAISPEPNVYANVKWCRRAARRRRRA